MEPVTHALASVTLSRAGLNRATRRATPIILASGVAMDLDWLSVFAGPAAYLDYYRALSHSLLGAFVLTVAVAVVFWVFGRSHPTEPLRFGRVLAASATGAGGHLLLDLTNIYGVQLLWPFRRGAFAWDWTDVVDPWVFILLALGLLLPGLFRLVSEEIGAHAPRQGAQRGALAALVLIAIYCGARGLLHERAVETLGSRLYHGAAPTAVEAFPSAASPLTWHGVVETENTVEEVEVPLGPGAYFDPNRARMHFKPEASPVLDAARQTETAERFLRFARFPVAHVQRTGGGYRVELRDLRFASLSPRRRSVLATIDLDTDRKVIREDLRFDTRPK